MQSISWSCSVLQGGGVVLSHLIIFANFVAFILIDLLTFLID